MSDDTTFSHWIAAHAPRFILAAGQDAHFCALHSAIVVGSSKARGMPSRMPCCIDHGLVPADATIVMMDLMLSTWGGAVKASGNTSLFCGPAARDFWSLVAHVDAWGDMAVTSWQHANTVVRYKAVATWWAHHRPDWGGQGVLAVTPTVMTMVYALSILLCDDAGLNAYADRNGGGNVDILRKDRQELLRKAGVEVHVFLP